MLFRVTPQACVLTNIKPHHAAENCDVAIFTAYCQVTEWLSADVIMTLNFASAKS